jgi:hypothetical protein
MSTADYINLTTDFGFKKFLSDPKLLLKFINAVLCLPDPAETIEQIHQIVKLYDARFLSW